MQCYYWMKETQCGEGINVIFITHIVKCELCIIPAKILYGYGCLGKEWLISVVFSCKYGIGNDTRKYGTVLNVCGNDLTIHSFSFDEKPIGKLIWASLFCFSTNGFHN